MLSVGLCCPPTGGNLNHGESTAAKGSHRRAGPQTPPPSRNRSTANTAEPADGAGGLAVVLVAQAGHPGGGAGVPIRRAPSSHRGARRQPACRNLQAPGRRIGSSRAADIVPRGGHRAARDRFRRGPSVCRRRRHTAAVDPESSSEPTIGSAATPASGWRSLRRSRDRARCRQRRDRSGTNAVARSRPARTGE